MDPLSITLAVGTIAKALWEVSKYLNNVRNSTDTASQASKDLADEVSTWYRTLHAVETGLNSPQIQAMEKLAEKGEKKSESDELWRSVAESVYACKSTIDRLQKGMKNMASDQASFPQQVWQRIKLNMKDNEMTSLRTRVRTHTNALQLVLQIISVRAAYLTPGSVVSELSPKIEALSKTMVSLQDSVSKQEPLEGDDEDFSNATTLIGSQYTENLTKSAEKVLSSAKTICAGKSEANLSIQGEPMDPLTRERTLNWIPEPVKEDDTVPFPTITTSPADTPNATSKTHDTSAPKSPMAPPKSPLLRTETPGNQESSRSGESISLLGPTSESNEAVSEISHTFGGTNQHSEGTMGEEDDVENEDSENDFEFEEAKIFLDDGSDLYHKGNFEDAREILHEACTQARRLSVKQQQQIDLGERQLMLATCVYHSGDLDGAEKHLFALTRENISRSQSTEKDSIRLCQASHLLAQVYLRGEKLDAAKQLCRKALIGRYRVLGKQDRTYNESLYLLSLIEEASGNPRVAEIHKRMIPPDMTYAVSELVKKSLKGIIESAPKSEEQQQQRPNRAPSDQPNIGSHRLSDYSMHSSEGTDSRSVKLGSTSEAGDTPATTYGALSDTPDEPKKVHSMSIHEYDDEDEGPFGPPAKRQTNSSLCATGGDKDIGLLPPSQLEVSNPDILKGFIKYLPSKHRQARDLVALDQLDNSVPSNILAWLERFNVDYDPFVTGLHVAAAVGHTEVLSTLLDRDIDPDSRMSKDHICPRRVPHYKDCTPLHFAATYGRVGITHLLLDHGASINALDWKRKSPVHYAARVGVSALLELLLKRGADGNMKDIDGITPLHVAAINGHARFLTLLLDSGIDVETLDHHHNTAIHAAAGAGQLEIVHLLLERGAELEAKNIVRHTPLQRAVEKGHLEVVQVCIDRGADIESRDVLGRTSLHTACNYGMPLTTKLLLEAGAKATERDAHNKTPKDLAKDRLNTDAEAVMKKWEKAEKARDHPKSPIGRRWTWSKQRSSSVVPKDEEALAKQMENLARQGGDRSQS